jgi:hypothetical protein
MKNFEKILLITVFFCILPVANLFALSQEATEAIEAMRARLRLLESNNEQPSEIVSSNAASDEYIPGRELSAVLARIRRERFESEKRFKQNHIKPANINENEVTIVEAKPVTEVTEENIIVANDQNSSEPEVSNEEKQVVAVPAVTSNTSEEKPTQTSTESEAANTASQDEIIIIEAMEAEDSEAWSVPIKNKTNESNQEETVVPAQKAEKSNEYVTGQLLERSIRRIRHSQRRNTPASSELDAALEDYEKRIADKRARNSQEVIANANEEIEELFNNSEKSSSIAEIEQNRHDEDIESSDNEENRIDDDKFNDYISKYDFKMPENYRIIVE